MSRLSRRAFLTRGHRLSSMRSRADSALPSRSEGAEPRRPVSQIAASELGRAWQQRQGQETPAGALPTVIAWLPQYFHDSEVPLPTRAKTTPRLRPPGALEEEQFLKTCTRCGDCQTACPHDAIRLRAVPQGTAATPSIDPSTAPCRLCDDLPCVTACTVDALTLDADARMGTARLNRFDCLNAMGTQCTVCQERCPVDSAIVFAGGLPVISSELCVGCGSCHFSCPAPTNAIAIMPNDQRVYVSQTGTSEDKLRVGD